MHPDINHIGIVVIGRNEGERLRRCLVSVLSAECPVVYADSGSTDGSVELARSMGAQVVELDPSKPFTASRGRNEGLARLIKIDPSVEFVQFVDGDCELQSGWLQAAAERMRTDERIAVLCGRLREKNRDSCIYARLCDMEWNGLVGETRASGGIAMMRASAFRQVGGFDLDLAAGEEADLCARLRRAGYRITRVADEMAVHDSGITRFEQWWGRAKRAGRVYAEAIARREGDPYKSRQFISAFIWAAILPIVAMGAIALSVRYPLMLLCVGIVLALYLTLACRIYRHRRHHGDNRADARLYSIFCVLSKWPQLFGQVGNWLRF